MWPRRGTLLALVSRASALGLHYRGRACPQRCGGVCLGFLLSASAVRPASVITTATLRLLSIRQMLSLSELRNAPPCSCGSAAAKCGANMDGRKWDWLALQLSLWAFHANRL